MKKYAVLLILSFLILPTLSFAKDVNVKGYYRKDGTYVSPHIRSSPDGIKWNNYGPSKNSNQLMNPQLRDNDRDGIPNYIDKDDDNDGIQDDRDVKQNSPNIYQKENSLDIYQNYNRK